MSNISTKDIPSPILGNEHGTWANYTVTVRFSGIVYSILKENRFSPEINSQLYKLIEEIPDGQIRYINDPHAPDADAWNNYVAPYLYQSWIQPPWFFTEHYFYRRILEATRFFQNGENLAIDPFSHHKKSGLSSRMDSVRDMIIRIKLISQNLSSIAGSIEELFYLDLWGNQADLSLWPAESLQKPDHTNLNIAKNYILVNDGSIAIEKILERNPVQRIDLLIDNAGFEIVCDLLLADYFLQMGLASSIKFHLKTHPTFVSDAIESDLTSTIETLASGNTPELQTVGNRLQEAVKTGKLIIESNWFWTSPLDGWEMPISLRDDLSKASLVISKGDAHYRRLLGDRHWSFTTPFTEIIEYFPAPLIVLRTLKSELVVGLKPDQLLNLPAEDPEWLINGRWGLIQFYAGEGNQQRS